MFFFALPGACTDVEPQVRRRRAIGEDVRQVGVAGLAPGLNNASAQALAGAVHHQLHRQARRMNEDPSLQLWNLCSGCSRARQCSSDFSTCRGESGLRSLAPETKCTHFNGGVLVTQTSASIGGPVPDCQRIPVALVGDQLRVLEPAELGQTRDALRCVLL